MKTSNKILLGAFLTSMLILGSIHIALYAKYKKGAYRVEGDNMWLSNMLTYPLDNVKYVSFENIENVTLLQGDSTKLQYEKADKDDDNTLSVTRKQDTLFLKGQSTGQQQGRWYKRTHLTLSGLLPLKVINSNLYIEDSKGLFEPSLDINLDASFLLFNRREKDPVRAGALKIFAGNKSRVELFNIHTNLLDIRLKNSSLEENMLVADSIKVATDVDSKLEITGNNVVKAKIVPYE